MHQQHFLGEQEICDLFSDDLSDVPDGSDSFESDSDSDNPYWTFSFRNFRQFISQTNSCLWTNL
jgi:hypothetical protein